MSVTVVENKTYVTVAEAAKTFVSVTEAAVNLSIAQGQPGIGIPSGGTSKHVLQKNSATSYDASWVDKVTLLPDGGLTGQRLTKVSGTNYDVAWQSPVDTPGGVDKDVQFNDAGAMAGDDNFKYDKNTKSVIIGIPDTLPDNPLAIGRAVDGWLQANINNTNEGESASCDWVATADNGSDLANYIDMGINSSIYDSEDYPFYEPNDGYLQGEVPRILINPVRDGSTIEFLTGGADTEHHRATIDENGLTMVVGHDIKIGTESVALATNRPEIYSGTGSPPSAVGLADGTLFFKYT